MRFILLPLLFLMLLHSTAHAGGIKSGATPLYLNTSPFESSKYDLTTNEKRRGIEMGYTFWQSQESNLNARAGLTAEGNGVNYRSNGYVLKLVHNF
ncbi:MAG: hypothetical protein ACK5XX_03740 [Holosporales bacterium]|jgi:hypothetical protein